MNLRAWHNEKEPPDERVPVVPLLTAVGALVKAASMCPSEVEVTEHLIGKMSGDGFDQACLDELIESLDRMLSEVIGQNGKMQVRYIGDLKPIDYDLHARFYHLTQHATNEDLKAIIENAISQGREEVTLINLANIRDIKITIGNKDVANLESEVKVVREAVEKFREWDKAGFWGKIEE